jgi:hypothetical protein
MRLWQLFPAPSDGFVGFMAGWDVYRIPVAILKHCGHRSGKDFPFINKRLLT